MRHDIADTKILFRIIAAGGVGLLGLLFPGARAAAAEAENFAVPTIGGV